MVPSYIGEPLTRDQLIFVYWSILASALDMIESCLASAGTGRADREAMTNEVDADPETLTSYERGALETAGMAMSIVFAQLTGEGLGAADALECCRCRHKSKDWSFRQMVEHWVRESVKSGRNTCQTPDNPNALTPDANPWAEAFVDAMFAEYLEQGVPCTH